MNTNQDYENLKYALCHLEQREPYENIRIRLISERGYDGFRALQNEVFKEIGTIKFENTQKYETRRWQTSSVA
jgi:hypothetical protein